MHTTTLAATIAMAAIYMILVRLIDFNEKEPLWAVVMLFLGGAGAAVALLLGVDSAFLELNLVPGVMATEAARFVGIGGGIAVLFAVGRSRGYSEINGLMDGFVYGASGGLGFATGLSFGREVLMPSGNLPLPMQTFGGYGELALVGLADGVFGALIGIGFAAASEARTAVPRAAAPVGGFAVAVMAHVAYEVIGRGNSLGDGALLRKWIAILLPIVAVAVVIFVALGRERRAISEELTAERDTGAVTPAELGVLQSMFARERMYLGRLFRADLGGWTAQRSLHNRQVQLALAKRRVASEQDDTRRLASASEVARLRVAVFELKRALGIAVPDASSAPPPTGAGASESNDESKEAG